MSLGHRGDATALDLRPAHGAPSAGPDLRRAGRWLAAFLLPVGPAAVALLRFVLPYDTVDDDATIVAKVAADPGAQSVVLWLGLVATLTLVLAALWVGRLTRRRAPVLTAAALLLLVPAYLSLAWLVAFDAVLWSGSTAGVDAGTLTRMVVNTHPTVDIAVGIFVVGHVTGTILLGGALWRSRAIPRWAAVLTIVSQPLHLVAAVILVSHALDLAAWGMQAVGFLAVAGAVIRVSDDEWDLAPAPEGADR